MATDLEKEQITDEVFSVLRDMSNSLAEISGTLISIKNDGLTLNSKVTDAFTDAIANGGLDGLLGSITGAANSTADVKDVMDAIKDPLSAAGDMNVDSAQSLIESLREAKERLSAISSAINTPEPKEV